MTLARRTRRRIDLAVALAIAVIVAVIAVLLWRGSDVRATSLEPASPGAAPATPEPGAAVPDHLTQRWQLTTDPTYGAVASPYGTVVTASEHSVIGHDVQTGSEVWHYTRTNRPLCGIGSGDTTTDSLDTWSGVHGIMTVYAKNGYCSQVTDFNPSTGKRLYQRTSPNEQPGELFFGTPYAGWIGSDYLELWRHDLVATIRYGNQPNPVDANGPHLGGTFSDVAVTADQLATIEHCGKTTNLVLNWPTPSDAPDKGDKNWDANHSVPKATIGLAGREAVIVGITADRVAVLLADPSPAVVVYDSHGTETSRTPVDITASEIAQTAAAGVTPSVTYADRRFTLVGQHLLAVSPQPVTVEVPVSTTSTAGSTTGSTIGSAPATSSAPGTAPTAPETTTETEQNPVLDWTAGKARGLPARIGEHVLVPTAGSLSVRRAASGTVTGSIPVDRGGYTGRVDASAIGRTIVEIRGGTVVGLAP